MEAKTSVSGLPLICFASIFFLHSIHDTNDADADQRLNPENFFRGCAKARDIVQQLEAFANLHLEEVDQGRSVGSFVVATVGNTTLPGQIELPFSELQYYKKITSSLHDDRSKSFLSWRVYDSSIIYKIKNKRKKGCLALQALWGSASGGWLWAWGSPC